jgi:hypothetical protein
MDGVRGMEGGDDGSELTPTAIVMIVDDALQ